MEQAYSHFNSGKYKDAYNLLSSSVLNIDSYQPNLAICQYMMNRCIQSSINCHKKLNQWLNKKFKRQNYKLDFQTQSIVKLNIGLLLIILGKRENAVLLLRDIYKNKSCFIEFMQSRILLLLMELNINLRNSAEVLNLYRKFPIKPTDGKNQSSQWISLILHEHNKSSLVCKQQFYFITKILLNHALIQLGIIQPFLNQGRDDIQTRDKLLQKVKKRKNNINKYYEINIIMINRFHEAFKQLHLNNYVKSLDLMNFNNMQTQYDKMPTTKIITNILNALATANTGIIYFTMNKPKLSLSNFLKAKMLLAKGCTGVQDKDLQLYSINYANQSQSITYNIALCLLSSKSKQAHSVFESIRKSNPNIQNFKFWYRTGQSILQHYHRFCLDKCTQEKKKILFQEALKCFTNSLNCLQNYLFPDQNILKSINPNLTQDQIQIAYMRFKSQKRQFKHSILTTICYIYNNLQKYNECIGIALLVLSQDTKKQYRFNALHYLFQAYSQIQTYEKVEYVLQSIKQQTNLVPDVTTQVLYSKSQKRIWTLNYQDLKLYQLAMHQIRDGQVIQAIVLGQSLRLKGDKNPNQALSEIMKYIHIKVNLEKQLIEPYLK